MVLQRCSPTRWRKAYFCVCTFALGVLFTLVTVWKLPVTTRTLWTLRHARVQPPTGLLKILTENNEPPVDDLLQILQTRIQNYSGPKLNWQRFKCHENITGARPCYDAACPGQFSASLKDRLQQILSVRTAIPPQYLQALASAAKPVTSHKYIFVTGASSNHYREMQALLHNVFQDLFPRMKGEDYTFVVYNLGLTPKERNLTEKNCRCTLIDFPFAALPDFMKRLKCYVWKPLIVTSLLEKAEYLVWMDASIRWSNNTPLADLFTRTKTNGYQTRRNGGAIAVRTLPSMARFFGDHLCQYAPFTEMETGLVFYYNDRFMREAIIPPLISCAFNTTCMCVQNRGNASRRRKTGEDRYGSCHRFEQSSIGIMLSKLFLENRPMLYLPGSAVRVRRGDNMNWFESS